MKNAKAKGILFTALSALQFGVTPALAALSYRMGSTPETLTFYRNLLVLPVLAVIMGLRRIPFRVPWRILGTIVLVGVLGRGITTLMLYSSYTYIGVGTATTLHFLFPVFVALICRVFYRERIGGARLAALVLACGGIVFFLEGGGHSLTGFFLAVASGLTYAFYIVGMDKKGLKSLNTNVVSFYMAAAVAGAMLLYNLPTGKIVFALPPAALGLTFVIALGTSLFAVALLQMGLRYLDATTAAILSLLEPLFGSLCGILWLGEAFTAAKIVGSVLILAGVTLLAILPGSPRKREENVSGGLTDQRDRSRIGEKKTVEREE